MELRQRIKMNFKAFWLFIIIAYSLFPIMFFATISNFDILFYGNLLIAVVLSIIAFIFLAFNTFLMVYETITELRDNGKEE